MFTKLILRSRGDLEAIAILLLLTTIPLSASAQTMSFGEIKTALDANPPTTGDPVLREEAILELDAYLKQPIAFTPEYRAFSTEMIADLAEELAMPVPSGARIWQMYNHGYIVKTPSSTFSFDLVAYGYTLPTAVLEQIDVAFVTHSHGDHDSTPSYLIGQLGGERVTVNTLPPGNQATIRGLDVSTYFGLHSVVNNIYHVTTPEGLTIMHTGDTQHSYYLPDNVPTDILLINAWMNESGSRPAWVGVRNGINRVTPDLTIPGHIHELNHSYVPSSPASRVPYEWALAVDDVPIPGDYTVMVPGEHYDYNVVPEPSALMLLGIGAVAVLGCCRRRHIRA